MANQVHAPTLEPRCRGYTNYNSRIQKDEVLKKLKAIKTSSAAGPNNIHPRTDNIHPCILKDTTREEQLYASRPISLTSVVCKMLEGLLWDQLMLVVYPHPWPLLVGESNVPTCGPTASFSVHLTSSAVTLKLLKERSQLLLGKQTFTQRVVDSWNNLPANVVNTPSINALKR